MLEILSNEILTEMHTCTYILFYLKFCSTQYNKASVYMIKLFERSLVSKDLDADGNDDLVVGAPGHSTSDEPQRGRVYIMYSKY